MVYQEAIRCGQLVGIAVPIPPAIVPDTEPCRVYIKYKVSAEATKCKEMMDGRMFDDNKVKADYVTELDYNRARAGEWILQGPGLPAGLPAGLPGGFPAGFPAGLSAGFPGSLPAGLPGGLPVPFPGMQYPTSLTGLPTITL